MRILAVAILVLVGCGGVEVDVASAAAGYDAGADAMACAVTADCPPRTEQCVEWRCEASECRSFVPSGPACADAGADQ